MTVGTRFRVSQACEIPTTSACQFPEVQVVWCFTGNANGGSSVTASAPFFLRSLDWSNSIDYLPHTSHRTTFSPEKRGCVQDIGGWDGTDLCSNLTTHKTTNLSLFIRDYIVLMSWGNLWRETRAGACRCPFCWPIKLSLQHCCTSCTLFPVRDMVNLCN